ncbi:Ubiquitin-conjugating enzyme E2Q-like protein 1 [Termitomyces sp. T112]|nr:Ubiquitin-conjugating enzyme E2Q-like protein 1 [Termitomyces sp. T112]
MGDLNTVPAFSSLGSTARNTHLRGRRRFNADLADIVQACSTGQVVEQGFRIQNLQAGNDEGIIEITISDLDGQHVLGFSLLVSETSDYPKNHVFFCSSSETNLQPHFLDVLESVASDSSWTIQETILKILNSLANRQIRIAADGVGSQEIDIDEDDNDYEGFDQFEEDLMSGSTAGKQKLDLQHLQNDFLEVVATGYRPGLLRFADDNLAISVSIPVVVLAKFIPPRALMAWDRRLLSRSQHLTLLISGFRDIYPPLDHECAYTTQAQRSGILLTFKVGLTGTYKPGKEHARDAGQAYGLIQADAEDEVQSQAEKAAALDDFGFDHNENYLSEQSQIPTSAVKEEHEEGSFDRFSLSSSLESLLDHSLLKLIQLRRKFELGWAGAELLLSIVEKTQTPEDRVFDMQQQDLLAADAEESQLAHTNKLPHDPLLRLRKESKVNIILTAFCYLIRRLSLCPRYCLVCHNKLNNTYEALKPYVCDSKLCTYQYYSFNQGPSLEYEIIYNPNTVDFLVSIAHTAATEQVLNDPLPIGLGLRVPPPDVCKIKELPRNQNTDGMCDFDDLSLPMMRAVIAALIDTLPSIDDMKKHLERKVKAGKAKPRLKDMDAAILPAAWSILRWCVASCTAYLEEITSGEESIKNLDPGWRQFRFSVGSPDAEARFKNAIDQAQRRSANAAIYPSLYAFHGSPLRNWHSIIRHGLWFKEIAHGRAYGHGVYLAKEGNISMGTYAQTGRSTWRKSRTSPTNCVALAEVVNLPHEFVSHNPYFVIKDTHWIICRYLLVKGVIDTSYETTAVTEPGRTRPFPFVKLDPSHPVTLNSRRIDIPEPTHQIAALLAARQEEFREEANDDEDAAVFDKNVISIQTSQTSKDDDSEEMMNVDVDSYETSEYSRAVTSAHSVSKQSISHFIDWKHDPERVRLTVEHLMPPPSEASPSATMAVQRELRAMLREQQDARSLKELGWFMPPEFVGDNLFQWIVEMHSFDDDLPVARDLKARNLNSVIFEIRFPPTFPIAPPFFRILTPRFLPFIQGGGGHVTAGGSICMDLLTSDGWLPSYSISAVLLQIRIAISNLEPRPARLALDYGRPYDTQEALVGFKRAAATHGWRVPVGTEKLLR